MMPFQPPPYFGDWKTGMGNKKKIQKRKGDSARTKQSIQLNSTSGKHLEKPKFIDIPLSNFDLLKWIDYLKVPNFKGIYSRDSKDHIHIERVLALLILILSWSWNTLGSNLCKTKSYLLF